MKTTNTLGKCLLGISLFFLAFVPEAVAQTAVVPMPATPATTITSYQYRRVADNKRDEFIRRETTYWAEIAKRALPGGNLKFWALLEKVGGYDLEHSSNFLFVNTFTDIDKVGDIYTAASLKAAFPTLSVDKMETGSISTVTSQIFAHDEGWVQGAGVNPDKDFNYLVMVYHNAPDAGAFIAAEQKHWAPFVKDVMDKKQTPQKGWGNAVVLSPVGPDMHFNTMSYDLYANLKEALNPVWDPKIVIPEGLTTINKLETERSSVVYRIVKVVTGE